jgi:hypothetical protein
VEDDARVFREKRHDLNAVPVQLVHDRWIGKYRACRAASLAHLKTELEEST